MPEAEPPQGFRRAWIEPDLTKHESLTALTRQRYEPVFDPNDPVADSAIRSLAVPGSQGFFP